jgi:hypothetical protein
VTSRRTSRVKKTPTISPSDSEGLVISIDPSPQHTGLLLIRHPEGRVLYARTLPGWAAVEEALGMMVIREGEVLAVIAEQAAPRGSPEQQELLGVIRWEFKDKLVLLNPGNWKPFAKANSDRIPKLKDEHQRDAYGMYLYWAEAMASRRKGGRR